MDPDSSPQDPYRVDMSSGGGAGGRASGRATPTTSGTGNNTNPSIPDDCMILSPSLADILSDDRILRFYQCVKDIRTQRSPMQTAAMFFALCHALGDNVVFSKVSHIPKVMFRQEHQTYAVNIAGTQPETIQLFNNHSNADYSLDPFRMVSSSMSMATPSLLQTDQQQQQPQQQQQAQQQHQANLFSAAAAAAAAAAAGAEGSPQELFQAALASVSGMPAHGTSGLKHKNDDQVSGRDTKKAKKHSTRDKDYNTRRSELIQDMLKVPETDLLHQASKVDDEVRMMIQGNERNTKSGLLSPLHRFATFANLPAHFDSDFAPKNSGVYYNYEYFQLYLAYRDLELEKQQEQYDNVNGRDTRPVTIQIRTEIEKVLVNTNWEAIRRRLTIGERIFQLCGIIGRGFLLLSKQVSGRKLLHNFNTAEWAELIREFQRPEQQSLLHSLQTKYSPERLFRSKATRDQTVSEASVIAPHLTAESSSSVSAAAAAAAALATAVNSSPDNPSK